MKTRTSPWDYDRKRYPRINRKSQDTIDRISEWWRLNYSYYQRGRLTHAELIMLVDRGPK